MDHNTAVRRLRTIAEAAIDENVALKSWIRAHSRRRPKAAAGH
ncbi:hypothetical protein ABIA35_002720 [Catenulispora sp. MAP12-49]